MLGVDHLRRGRPRRRLPARVRGGDRAWRRPTPRRASACSSASPARPSRTRSSAATGRTAPAACAAGAAWSAARTAPRTRWSRTTCGSRSARARGSCPSAPSSTSEPLDGGRLRGHERALRRVGPQASGGRRPRAASSSPRARSARTGCWRRASSTARSRSSRDRLGELVRTNSEAILAVTLPEGAPDVTRRVAITGSIYPDPRHAHRDRRLRRARATRCRASSRCSPATARRSRGR